MFGIENSANNFGRSAGLLSNTIANLPLRAALGTLFIASDTLVIYRWTGTGWVTIGGGGGAFNGAENGLDVNFNNKVVLGGNLLQNTQIICNNYLIKFDGFSQFAIGNNLQPSMLFDSGNGKITTSYNGNLVGLSFDYPNNEHKIFDWNAGTYIIANINFNTLQTFIAGSGFGISAYTSGTKIGDWGGSLNNTQIEIDFSTLRITFNSNDGKYQFNNIPVYANNAAALAGGLLIGDLYRVTGTGNLHIVF